MLAGLTWCCGSVDGMMMGLRGRKGEAVQMGGIGTILPW